jgi:hypothetical protein
MSQNTHKKSSPIASPEWVVSDRADRDLDPMMRRGWEAIPAPLQRGASFTDFATHEIAVPVGESVQAKAVRLHELVHARISPSSVPAALMTQLGISPASVRIAEEVRVNWVAGRALHSGYADIADIAEMTDGSERGLADEAVKNKDWRSALSLLLSTYNTKAYKVVKRRLRINPDWKEATDVIQRHLKERHWEVNASMAYSRARRRSDTSPVGYRWTDTKTKGSHNTFLPNGFVEHTLPLATTIDQWMNEPPSAPKKGRYKTTKPEEKNKPPVVPMSSHWEELRWGMTSLTESASSFIGRRKRPAMTGKFPSRPDRLLTDPERRIFREIVRGEGGTVVFDCSGSMSVSHDDVKAILKHFAGATIMAYTYRGDEVSNAWILARNGRMIGESEFEHLDLNHGNGVDSPALRWAIRQRKKPKDFIVWVSDGFVTGKGDYATGDLIRECALLSYKYNIIGVEDANEAVRLVAEMKRGVRPRHRFVEIIADSLGKTSKRK